MAAETWRGAMRVGGGASTRHSVAATSTRSAGASVGPKTPWPAVTRITRGSSGSGTSGQGAGCSAGRTSHSRPEARSLIESG